MGVDIAVVTWNPNFDNWESYSWRNKAPEFQSAVRAFWEALHAARQDVAADGVRWSNLNWTCKVGFQNEVVVELPHGMYSPDKVRDYTKRLVSAFTLAGEDPLKYEIVRNLREVVEKGFGIYSDGLC